MKAILLVEDEKNIRLSIRMVLQQHHFRVIETDNGIDAVKLAQDELPALILMDILIPGMDGYLACEAIRHNPLTRQIPIVFMSAKSQPEDREKAHLAGGNDYLVKPFTADQLVNCIQQKLGGTDDESTHSGS